MNYIDVFKEEDIEVNWLTLLIGLDGPANFPPLVDVAEIINFAIELLDGTSDRDIISIATAYVSESEAIRSSLMKLSKRVDCNEEFEMRKWRYILLKSMMKDVPQDSLYGLIFLTEFWADFDYPSDRPHLVQGQKNSLTPEEYYSDEFFEKTIANHYTWLKQELNILVKQ
ncbi:DUF2247 family protein [Marininema halotolerans]|uniref:DUF2247 domain-containing protein n=1 Tax=Marininema halotolerans TaxID=1155944 RepID=A0A1I6UMX2_9BACL|nr:DUF2247 family protein [Marininema halotolerans]SFT02805.1 hypothetical protein SAMN05444972_11839 [Marininema halotolerans]